VVLALTGMLIIPFSVFTSMGAGAILVVLTAVVAALTLLPAVLALLGERPQCLAGVAAPCRPSSSGDGGIRLATHCGGSQTLQGR
jgi:hypothetical protein